MRAFTFGEPSLPSSREGQIEEKIVLSNQNSATKRVPPLQFNQINGIVPDNLGEALDSHQVYPARNSQSFLS